MKKVNGSASISQQENTNARGRKKQEANIDDTANDSQSDDESPKEELEDDESASEITAELDSDELSEVLDFMKPDNPADIVSYRPDEDEETDGIQEPFRYPRQVSGRKKKSTQKAIEDRGSGSREETEQKLKSRWFITTCRYCGNMFRFPSDQPQPSTCGRPDCILKEESRKRETVAAV